MEILTAEQSLLLDIIKNIAFPDDNKILSPYIPLVDWEVFLQLSVRHMMLPSIYHTIYEYIPIKFQAAYDNRYFELIKKIRIYLLELARIKNIAEQNGILIVLLKGFALGKIIYDDVYNRQFKDIDLLVEESNVEKMYYSLNNIGYIQETGYNKETNRYNTLDKPIYKHHLNFHELQCVKEIGKSTYIHVEIKRASTAIPLKYIKDFLKNTTIINVDGVDLLTSNLTYTFLHLCSHVYANFETEWGILSETNLRDIVDVMVFFQKYRNTIKWEDISVLSTKYEILHKVFFVLRSVNLIKPQTIPENIIEQFNPAKISYEYHGNTDGTANNWSSSFLSRLFDDSTRKKEFVRSKKMKIYRIENYHRIIEVNAEASENDIKATNYIHYAETALPIDICYNFVCNENELTIVILINNELYTMLPKYTVFFYFVDNNLDNAVPNRIITITTEKENLQVNAENIANFSWKCINYDERDAVRVTIPIENLCIERINNTRLVLYNFALKQKLGIDGFQTVSYKHGADDLTFLRLNP